MSCLSFKLHDGNFTFNVRFVPSEKCFTSAALCNAILKSRMALKTLFFNIMHINSSFVCEMCCAHNCKSSWEISHSCGSIVTTPIISVQLTKKQTTAKQMSKNDSRRVRLFFIAENEIEKKECKNSLMSG